MRPSRVLRSILALPFVVTAVIPTLLIGLLDSSIFAWHLPFPANLVLLLLAALLILAGVSLMISTIALFAQGGQGTLAPWDPTERLVIQGPYRHVRNPMISGVFFILLGDSLLFLSVPVFVWFMLFLVANLFYIPRVEEAGLEEQFGEAYRDYKRNVPAWIPRIRAWEK